MVDETQIEKILIEKITNRLTDDKMCPVCCRFYILGKGHFDLTRLLKQNSYTPPLSACLQLSGPHFESFDQKLQTVSLILCFEMYAPGNVSLWSTVELRTVDQCVYLYVSFPSIHARVRSCEFPRYFPASSTREMLDEWRPLLCVFDVVMQKAVSNMELFLPTIMPPEEHSQGFQ